MGLLGVENEMIIQKNAKPAIYDENLNIIRYCSYCGSGCYHNAMFACSKCGKSYCTLGALKFYHKKCLKVGKK